MKKSINSICRIFYALFLLGMLFIAVFNEESITNSDIVLTIIVGILFLENKDNEKTN